MNARYAFSNVNSVAFEKPTKTFVEADEMLMMDMSRGGNPGVRNFSNTAY